MSAQPPHFSGSLAPAHVWLLQVQKLGEYLPLGLWATSSTNSYHSCQQHSFLNSPTNSSGTERPQKSERLWGKLQNLETMYHEKENKSICSENMDTSADCWGGFPYSHHTVTQLSAYPYPADVSCVPSSQGCFTYQGVSFGQTTLLTASLPISPFSSINPRRPFPFLFSRPKTTLQG